MVLMLTGLHPFTGSSSTEVYKEILNQELDTSGNEYKHISPLGIDLIKKLLVKDPKSRLTVQQALAHPWMKQAREEKADIDIIRSIQRYKPPSEMWRAAIAILVKYMKLKQLWLILELFYLKEN